MRVVHNHGPLPSPLHRLTDSNARCLPPSLTRPRVLPASRGLRALLLSGRRRRRPPPSLPPASHFHPRAIIAIAIAHVARIAMAFTHSCIPLMRHGKEGDG